MFNNAAMAVPVVDLNSGNNCNNRNGLFGNNDDILALIILFAVFGGAWGGGYGNNRNSGGCGSGETTIIMPPTGGYGMNTTAGFTDAAITNGFNNQAVINKLDGINGGICGLGYDQLNQMNGINTNIMQTGFGLQNAINQNTVAGMQNTNALQTQISSCCCDMRAGLKDISYDMATQNCALRNEVHQTGDAIIQSQNWGFRNLQDQISAGFNELARQNDQRYIRELEAKLNACDRDRALQDTANYILGVTNPRAVPAYPSCNPNCYGNWSSEAVSGYGNNGCCCRQAC